MKKIALFALILAAAVLSNVTLPTTAQAKQACYSLADYGYPGWYVCSTSYGNVLFGPNGEMQ
jgi:hypothetical protein